MIVEARVRPLVALLAILGAFVVTGLLAAASGAPPLTAYQELISGALGTSYGIGVTLNTAVPLILVALSFIVGARCGELNVGIEGQLYMGALASTAVGVTLDAPRLVTLCIAVLAGAAAGALWFLIPGLLKLWRDVNEIVTGLLLNYVAISLTSYLLSGPLHDPDQDFAASKALPTSATFPILLPDTTLSIGFPLVLVIAAGLYFLLTKTTLGFELRTVGANRRAGRFVGMELRRVAVAGFLLSGALGGLAGSMEVLGNQHRLVESFSPGWGYTGIIVALLGGLSAIGAVLAGVIFAVFEAGGDAMQRTLGIPTALTLVMNATAVLIYLAAGQIRIVGRLQDGVRGRVWPPGGPRGRAAPRRREGEA